MTFPLPPRNFTEFAEGATYEYGAYEVTREEILSFAGEFDPQPFHLDEEVAKTSLLGGLAASGWHTASMAMRMHVDHLLRGENFLISPGIPELSWMKPVYAGEILRVQAHVKSLRASGSKPGVSILDTEFTLLNQNNERKMVNRGVTFVGAGNGAQVIGALPPKSSVPGAMPEPRGINDPTSLQDNGSLLSGYWDDQPIGQTFDMGTHHFDDDNITRYARAYDPQPFHSDAEAARHGPFGKLVASGWHTAAAGMGRLVLSRKPYAEEAQRRGLPQTPKGPSPGFRDLKWMQPVYSGDTLRYTMTPADKRKTSREGWGIVFTRVEGWNQRGEKPFEYTSASLWPLRPA